MGETEQFTCRTAEQAATDGRLVDWMADFLASDGSDNAALGQQLSADYAVWFGPVQIGFDHLHRLAGPPEQPTIDRLGDDDLDTVESMEASIDDDWTPPPFVVTWQGDHLLLEDGNHRVESLRRAGHDRWWCVVGARDEQSKREVNDYLRTLSEQRTS